MLPQRAPRPQGRRRNRQNTLRAIDDHIEDMLGPSLLTLRMGRVMRQSPYNDGTTHVRCAGVGEAVESGHDYAVLVPYVTPNMALAGGPAANDNVLIWEPSPGQPRILGKLVQSNPGMPFVSAAPSAAPVVGTVAVTGKITVTINGVTLNLLYN